MLVVGATVVHSVASLDLRRGEASTHCGQVLTIARGLLNGDDVTSKQLDDLWDQGILVSPCCKCGCDDEVH